MSYPKVIQQIRNRVFHPVYLLHGEEPYFIDQIANVIAGEVLQEHEKEFNQMVVYGSDTDATSLVSLARRFPMMSSHMVVIVREAQQIKDLEPLVAYLENPQESTLLVLCYKHGKVDGRSKLIKAFQKHGLVFLSNKVKDHQLPDWIRMYVRERRYEIADSSSVLLADYLGNDLAKISNELEKVFLGLAPGSQITPEVIEHNIGISKDFNVFELRKAIGQKNLVRANQIVLYFINNPKEHPLPRIIPSLYLFFSQLLMLHYAKTNDRQKLASVLGVHPFFVSEYQQAAKHYSVQKLLRIISYLRYCDVQSKGINGVALPHGELLKEFLFKVMH